MFHKDAGDSTDSSCRLWSDKFFNEARVDDEEVLQLEIVSNYRPVSLTSSLSKMLEIIIKKQLVK